MVRAGEKSGALITAGGHGGRACSVFAVPGDVRDDGSRVRWRSSAQGAKVAATRPRRAPRARPRGPARAAVTTAAVGSEGARPRRGGARARPAPRRRGRACGGALRRAAMAALLVLELAGCASSGRDTLSAPRLRPGWRQAWRCCRRLTPPTRPGARRDRSTVSRTARRGGMPDEGQSGEKGRAKKKVPRPGRGAGALARRPARARRSSSSSRPPRRRRSRSTWAPATR